MGRRERSSVNAEQAKGWNGPDGEHWAAHDAWYNAAIARHSLLLLEAAAIGATEHVLDVGCGAGETTRHAARAARDGSAFGLDLSAPMLRRATERAASEGLANVRFEQGDAQVYGFEPASFDIAISRFGVMFFDDPAAAFTNIGRAVKPGGRLAFLCWQQTARNEWLTAFRAAIAPGAAMPEPPPGAPSPVSLADGARVRQILTTAGFGDAELVSIDEPMHFGPDAARAFDAVTGLGSITGMLAEMTERAKAEALERLRAVIHDRETPEGVSLGASAWLVRARKGRQS